MKKNTHPIKLIIVSLSFSLLAYPIKSLILLTVSPIYIYIRKQESLEELGVEIGQARVL